MIIHQLMLFAMDPEHMLPKTDDWPCSVTERHFYVRSHQMWRCANCGEARS